MHRTLLFILILIVSYGSAHASTAAKVMAGLNGTSQWSIQFVRLSDGQTIYQENPQLLLVPASTSKLITAAAALAEFRPQFIFETPVFYNGQISKGILKGSLIIRGQGDPFLVSEKLWEMAQDLRFRGLIRVEGDLLLDQSYFDAKDRDEARLRALKYSRNAYDAPILPLSINFNTFAVAAAVDLIEAKPVANVWPHPLPSLVNIQNNLQWKNSPPKLAAERITAQNKAVIRVSGSVNGDHEVRKVWKSVSDGNIASGEYIRAFLEAAGITVTGQIRVYQTSKETLKPLYTIKGYPLTKAIEGLNKYSNNFIADMLTKTLGARNSKPPQKGTFENGAAALSQFLANKVGVKSKFVIDNGSGLSLNNRLSAEQLCQLLSFMHEHLELFPEFLASLPASGLDGTLADRFPKDLQGSVRAKTGTLSDPVSVSSLAGYFRHKQHGLVAFAIIENGILGKKQPSIVSMRARQEKLIESL